MNYLRCSYSHYLLRILITNLLKKKELKSNENIKYFNSSLVKASDMLREVATRRSDLSRTILGNFIFPIPEKTNDLSS